MSIREIEMLVDFSEEHAADAAARIEIEMLGRLWRTYGDNGVLATGSIARIKVSAPLISVAVFETMPGYLGWEPVRHPK